MNGLELLELVRAQDKDLEMVIFTGFGDMKSAVAALRAGAYDYLSKPIDTERLVQTLKIGAERRFLKIENRKLIENLTEASRLKNDFLHGMSHEIRTPLGHITGFAEILEQTIEGLSEKQERYLHNIQGAAKRLLGMFYDMLQYADMSTEADLQLSPILVSDLIRQVRSSLADAVSKAGIEFNPEMPEPVVRADFSICEKMLEVVVQNAVQFSPPNGKIDIRAEIRSEPAVREDQLILLPLPSAHWLHISVTDQGPGIAPEDQERIFNLFEQGDGSLAREHEGTGLGLGLALGRSLARRHNGLISVQCIPGQGSTFTLVIPVTVS